jgi:hypothetical protein
MLKLQVVSGDDGRHVGFASLAQIDTDDARWDAEAADHDRD